jgi:hypothetical protein
MSIVARLVEAADIIVSPGVQTEFSRLKVYERNNDSMIL